MTMVNRCLLVQRKRVLFLRPSRQEAGSRGSSERYFKLNYAFGLTMYARVIMDIQNALFALTGSFRLCRMTRHARMMCQQSSTPLDIPDKMYRIGGLGSLPNFYTLR